MQRNNGWFDVRRRIDGEMDGFQELVLVEGADDFEWRGAELREGEGSEDADGNWTSAGQERSGEARVSFGPFNDDGKRSFDEDEEDEEFALDDDDDAGGDDSDDLEDDFDDEDEFDDDDDDFDDDDDDFEDE